MGYELSIKGESGTIRIVDDTGHLIKRVKFDIYQKDKLANDRSEQLFNSVRIEGLLNEKTTDSARDILEWSKKTEREEIYRTVSIQIKSGGKLIRDYYLKDMFCVSYEEIFDEYDKEDKGEEMGGTFILEMKQRNGSINTIVVE